MCYVDPRLYKSLIFTRVHLLLDTQNLYSDMTPQLELNY